MLTNEEHWLVNHAKDGQNRSTCPWCSPTRKKKTETCLSVYRDYSSIKFQCYHPDCGVSGLIRLTERSPNIRLVPPVEKKQPAKSLTDYEKIDDRHMEWLSERGISSSTAHAYDLIGQEIGGQAVVGFPYFNPDGGVAQFLMGRVVLVHRASAVP